jgi:glutathione S-transferase
VDPIDRAQMRRWTQIPDTGLHRACAVVTFAIAFRHQEQSPQLAALSPAEREARLERNRLGLDAPGADEQMRFYDRVITDMARQLDNTPWLAGEQFSLADIGLLPYVVRLEQLALSWLWDGPRASVGVWLGRFKARWGFAGIKDYLNPHYLDLMLRTGVEARPKVEAIVAAGLRDVGTSTRT